jgi:hypothetical protein
MNQITKSAKTDDRELADVELTIVAGGRRQVSLDEYMKILADAKSRGCTSVSNCTP